jgi:3-polyprenyl-4-hydroxybenzoate decarboxylase
MSEANVGAIRERPMTMRVVHELLKVVYRGQIVLKRVPAVYSLLSFVFPLALIVLAWGGGGRPQALP